MSTIVYQVRITPVEVPTFGNHTKIVDTREVRLDFDIALLNESQRTLWLMLRPLFNKLTIHDYSVSAMNYPKAVPAVFDSELTLDEAFEAIQVREQIKTDVERELAARFAERMEALKIEAEARRANTEALKAQQQADYQQALAEAHTIPFDENGKAILNLYNRLVLVSEVDMDSRFSGNWIKRITAVDTAKANGYAFEGEWVRDQTVEISRQNAVYLIAGTSGSRKYATTKYVVVTQRGDKLEKTDISASSNDRGWALIIRDRVAQLITEGE